MAEGKGAFTVEAWDENPYLEGDDMKMTFAVVKQSFRGDVDGSGEARWLMAYRADGTARFVGLQRVECTVGGRTGSFVMETAGDFDGSTAKWSGKILDGCGGGELSEASGSGDFAAPFGSEATYELDLTAT